MARIRTVKPEFWRHPVISRLPDQVQLMALALLSMADDEGYFHADAAIVRGEVMPFREDLASISACLAHLSKVGWIDLWNHPEQGQMGVVVNWTKHQKIDHASKSKLKTYDIRETLAKESRETRETLAHDQGSGNREQGTGNRDVAKAPKLKTDADILIAKHPFKISGPKRNHKAAISELLKKSSVSQIDNFLEQLQDPLWPDQLVAQGSKWVHGSDQASSGPYVQALTPDQIAYGLEIELEAQALERAQGLRP